MKTNGIIVTVKLKEVLDAPLLGAWTRMCEKYSLNEWCLNEGLVDENSTVEITLEDAELYGLVERE